MDEDFGCLIFSFGMMILIIILNYHVDPALRCPQQITPEVRIVIENGIADTTYIYKRSNCK